MRLAKLLLFSALFAAIGTACNPEAPDVGSNHSELSRVSPNAELRPPVRSARETAGTPRAGVPHPSVAGDPIDHADVPGEDIIIISGGGGGGGVPVVVDPNPSSPGGGGGIVPVVADVGSSGGSGGGGTTMPLAADVVVTGGPGGGGVLPVPADTIPSADEPTDSNCRTITEQNQGICSTEVGKI